MRNPTDNDAEGDEWFILRMAWAEQWKIIQVFVDDFGADFSIKSKDIHNEDSFIRTAKRA